MIIGVPKEIYPSEQRVALVPRGVEALRKMGFDVIIESNAGEQADYSNAKYEEVGATISKTPEDVWSKSDIVIKIITFPLWYI